MFQTSMLQILFLYGVLFIFVDVSCALAHPDDAPSRPSFALFWSDDRTTFISGDTATIQIRVLGSFDPPRKQIFAPSISVNGRPGNNTFISGVSFNLTGDPNSWSISFLPILAGVHNVLVTEDHFGILDSSLHFSVLPGPMHPAMSAASWMDSVNEFKAGTRGMALILPKDAFGNKLLSTAVELNSYVFNVSASFGNGSVASVLSVTSLGWNRYGYLMIEFIAATAGDLLLHIKAPDGQAFQGSPIPFKVQPGTVEVSKCVASWKHGSNVLQLYSAAEVLIHQRDIYGNLVPGLYPLGAEVLHASTNLSFPVADLRFGELSYGVQVLTFTAVDPGDYLLSIKDAYDSRSIAIVRYNFTVFIGYCDETNSIINGSGLNTSFAGQDTTFSVYLYDRYHYPSKLDMRNLQVQITLENTSYSVTPTISPIETSIDESIGHEAVAPQPSFGHSNASEGVFTYAYSVLYRPEKAGVYDIRVLCGNVMVSARGGHPLKKEVKAGEVNVSMSAVVRYAPKVETKVKNEIVVSLADSFSNPVLSQDSKLKLETGFKNLSAYSPWSFLDNKDGSYTGYYRVEEVGTHVVCPSFDGIRFSCCPNGVNAYSGEYFPKPHHYSVSVFEDESVAFNVLENEKFSGDNTSMFREPRHGSLLRSGLHFRYTPHKEFSGNDSFTFSVSDVNGNVAAVSVNISVLHIPPQFASFPPQLGAMEDSVSPRFGGFHGFLVTYQDPQENLSLTLNASFGTVSLNPWLLNFWTPSWNGVSVSSGGEEAGGLMITGHLEVINNVLNSIQYLGNENFFGEDVIRMSISNENGMSNSVNITMTVDPVNDPPYIRAPEYIVLEDNGAGKGSPIYNEKHQFEFMIGDPDLSNFPGDKSQFLVMFSIEVDSGALEAALPAKLIETTELKQQKCYPWEPLQTYVSISGHFTVKAKGLRFQGTLEDCNGVIELLKFHGDEDGALLTLSVNDLGSYGCNGDCAENTSRPLYAEANINLLSRRPISCVEAYTLGAVIILQLIMVLSLGVVLLYYTCKCVVSLVPTRQASRTNRATSPNAQPCSEQKDAACSEGPSCSRQRRDQGSRGGDDGVGSPEISIRPFAIEQKLDETG